MSAPDDELQLVSWATLPDDVLRRILRINLTPELLSRVSGACSAWRAVADGNDLWQPMVNQRWPETVGLRVTCTSYRALHARLRRADSSQAMRETPSELLFMVRIRMGEGAVVLAHTFALSEMESDGTWLCPDLRIPDDVLLKAAADYAAKDMMCFRDFCCFYDADVRPCLLAPPAILVAGTHGHLLVGADDPLSAVSPPPCA